MRKYDLNEIYLIKMLPQKRNGNYFQAVTKNVQNSSNLKTAQILF